MNDKECGNDLNHNPAHPSNLNIISIKIKVFLLFLLLINSICFLNPSMAELNGNEDNSINSCYDEIRCSFILPEGNAEIGHPYTFSYEITGGSGSFEDVYLIIEYLTGELSSGYVLERDQLHNLDVPNGICTLEPRIGNVLFFQIRGKDAITGETFSEEPQTNIWIDQNSRFDVLLEFEKEYYNIGEEITAIYSVNGLTEMRNARIWCYIASNQSSSPYNGIQTITSLTGTYSILPVYGFMLYAVLEAEDQDGNPIYAQSKKISFDTMPMDPITCSFSLPEGNAEIGHPYTFSYEITGGSGSFEDVYFTIEYMTGDLSYGYILKWEQLNNLDVPNGICTVIPRIGNVFGIHIRGNDAVTGETFSDWPQTNILIDQNSDFNISVEFSKDNYEIGEEISATYYLEGINELWNVQIWSFIEEPYYGIQTISSERGTYSYTPQFGRRLYIVITGKDNENHPFYYQSEEVTIGSIIPVACVFTFPDEDPQIGQPYTISYELSGGSGNLSDLQLFVDYFCSDETYGEYDRYINIIEREVINLKDLSGTIVLIPPKGSYLSINISGRDLEGDYFWLEPDNKRIKISPNYSCGVSIQYDKEKYEIGDIITINYTIDSTHIKNATLWWYSNDSGYSERETGIQHTTKTKDSFSFIPANWKCIYAVIEGENENGDPFYCESEHLLNLDTKLSDNVLILPASTEVIQASAFNGVGAGAIVIPDTIKFIANNAFDGSKIRTLVSNTEYVNTFARNHGFGYINSTNIAME